MEALLRREGAARGRPTEEGKPGALLLAKFLDMVLLVVMGVSGSGK